MQYKTDSCWNAASPFRTIARFVLPALVLIATASSSGCSEQKKHDALRLGLSVWPPNEMAYLARDLGMFDGSQIQLIEDVMPTEYVPTIANGVYDGIALSLGSAAQVLSINSNYRIVLFMSYSNGADAIVAHPEFDSLQSLRGEKVGYEPFALGTYVLNRLLATAGMTTRDIIPVPIDGIDQAAAFNKRQVAAIVTFDPTASRLVAAGARKLADSRSLPSEIMDVLLVQKTVLEERRADLEAFTNAWFEALRFHVSHPDQAAGSSEARGHYSTQEYGEAFKGVAMIDREANLALYDPNNPELRKVVELHTAFLQEVGLTTGTFELSQVLDSSLIAAATKQR